MEKLIKKSMTYEKSYIHVLRYLFERGDENEIKRYILNFDVNDESFDIFIQKLQELAKSDDIDIIEDMINDETLLKWTKKEDYQDYDEFDDLNNQIPESDDDELSIENLKKDVSEQGGDFLEKLAAKLGIEDMS